MPEVTMTRAEFKERKKRFLIGVANDTVTALQRRCPVDSGRLRASIKYAVKGNVIEISMVGYALYVEFGTAPHIIKPVKGKALKFKGSEGDDVFAKEVHHPGTAPQPFIRSVFRFDLPDIVRRNAQMHFTG